MNADKTNSSSFLVQGHAATDFVVKKNKVKAAFLRNTNLASRVFCRPAGQIGNLVMNWVGRTPGPRTTPSSSCSCKTQVSRLSTGPPAPVCGVPITGNAPEAPHHTPQHSYTARPAET